jgi:hypothetical protein
MTQATVSRGGVGVTFDIYQESGQLHIARDIGKPASKVYHTSKDAPRVVDQRAPLKTFTIVGQLVGDDAYSDARALAEKMFLPHSDGDDMTLDLSGVTGLGSYTVFPTPGTSSLRLHYPPRQRHWVSLQASFAVVGNTIGGDGSFDAPSYSEKPSFGSAIRLSRGGTSVDLTHELDIRRSCGRPESHLQHTSSDTPYAVDRPRAYSDVFEVSGMFVSDDASTDANTLQESIIEPRLGYDTLTLDFLDDLYSLGSYSVMPVDTLSSRVSWAAREKNIVRVDRLKLMVVNNEGVEE